MTDTQAIVAGILIAPAVFLVILGMLKGYQLTLKIFKPHPKHRRKDQKR